MDNKVHIYGRFGDIQVADSTELMGNSLMMPGGFRLLRKYSKGACLR